MVRAAYALGGLGSGLCGDEEKLRETTEKVCGKHDHHDDHHHVIIIITIIFTCVIRNMSEKTNI
jgi:carbamoylphosphate synthase large subunit